MRILVSFALLSLPISSYAADPCNFSKPRGYSVDQVKACYDSVPFCPNPSDKTTCDRDTQVAYIRDAIEAFSDVKDVYDARNHWRRQLDVIAKTRFKSDFAMYTAFSNFAASFADDHWFYNGASCYEDELYETIPIQFGSAIAGGRQIIFLRDVISEGGGSVALDGLVDLYAEFSGIDVSTLVGDRVVSIQGQEPLAFFRAWGRTYKADDNDSINLMSILDEAGYTLRGGSYNPFPESSKVTLVLERPNGRRRTVELPWMAYAQTDTPPKSTADFRARCFAPTPAPDGPVEPSAATRNRFALSHRRERRHHIDTSVSHYGPSHRRRGSSEQPNEVGPATTEVYPLKNGARTVRIGNTVAIQLRNDFEEDWRPQVKKAAKYACNNADSLIIDLRGNLGGYVDQVEWIARYFAAPGTKVFPDSRLYYRELAKSPAFNEIRDRSEELVEFGFDACTTGWEAACVLDTKGRESQPGWYKNYVVERRGDDAGAYTPIVTFLETAFDRIPCAGKFVDDKLIVLVNGLNASAGYLGAERLGEIGKLVLIGGYVNEPMTIGRARGGAVLSVEDFRASTEFLEEVLETRLRYHIDAPPRSIGFFFEIDGFYRPDLQTLYVNKTSPADARLLYWSNTEETDGAIYNAAVRAVRR